MSSAVVLPLVLVLAVVAMVAVLVLASRSDRHARSLERAEREGLLGAEGLRHAEERADAEWVRKTSPADNNSIGSVVGHTIADRAHIDPR